MTHEEKLNAVTTAIREKLPHLMKLEKGCIIIKDNSETEIIGISHLGDAGDDFYTVYQLYDDFVLDTILDVEFEEKTIIGKEPMLNDVLKWVLQNPRGKHFDPTGMGGFVLKNYNTRGTVDFAEWNLTKPYLKDQSKELINWLYELIREEL